MDDKINEVMGLVHGFGNLRYQECAAYNARAFKLEHKQDAALVAIESKLRELVQVPPGYALVPVEPTKAMIEAAEEAYMPFGAMELAYAAMLSAAPKDLVAAAQQGR